MSVYNFSSEQLTDGEISLLNLGTKFVPATIIPEENTKIDILKFSRKLLLKGHFFDSDYSDDSIVKPSSCYIPKKVKSTVLKSVVEDLEIFANEFPNNMPQLEVRDNLTVEQREGLKSFQKHRRLLYFKADKGTAVCLLNELFYKYKILEVLNTDKYEKLPRNVDYFVVLKLRALVNRYKHVFTKPEIRAITKFAYRTTNIYGLPKIHKSKIIKDAIKDSTSTYLHLRDPLDLKFRLIFGGPKNPCSVLADLLNTVLEPIRSKVKSSLKDVYAFKKFIPKFKPEDLPFIRLYTVDVDSMYPNLDQKLGLPSMRFYLPWYKELLPPRFTVDFIIEAMTFVLNNNTGYFNGEIYRQVTGTATGIKPAPAYADLSMGYLEIKLFYKLRARLGKKIAFYFWDMYRRYLDDGIIFWDTRLGDFEDVFDIMNKIHPGIRFTMESSDHALKYLDVLVYKDKEGFKTVVQNKDTDSGSYVHFDSSHPRHCKENIPFSMARRVRALTDDDDLALVQMSELKSKFKLGNYPQGLVNSAVQNAMMLSPLELRMQEKHAKDDDIITFVHTFDPAHPELIWKIRSLVSRLYMSVDTMQIFGDTKIIDSRREPSNLLRIFQHSRFDESGSAARIKGVSKCNMPRCKLCEDIIETDSIFFNNLGCNFRIDAQMDCTVRNVVYALFCGGCAQSYVGETVCLRDRATSHRSNSKVDPTEDTSRVVAEVSKHLHECGQGFKICPIVKVKDECKILRLFIEDQLIKLLKPDLNADRRNLLHLQGPD